MKYTYVCEQCYHKAIGFHISEGVCQACCEHDEYDHDICLDCGYERDPGEAIDKAMDYMEDR